MLSTGARLECTTVDQGDDGQNAASYISGDTRLLTVSFRSRFFFALDDRERRERQKKTERKRWTEKTQKCCCILVCLGYIILVNVNPDSDVGLVERGRRVHSLL